MKKLNKEIRVLLTDAYILMDTDAPVIKQMWKKKYEELVGKLAEHQTKKHNRAIQLKKEEKAERLNSEKEKQRFIDTTHECGKPEIGWSPDAGPFCQDCWNEWREKGYWVRSLPRTGGIFKQRLPKVMS